MKGLRNYRTKCTRSDKDKYHMISIICGIQKNDAIKLPNRKRLTDIHDKFMVAKGKELGSGAN